MRTVKLVVFACADSTQGVNADFIDVVVCFGSALLHNYFN